MTLLSHLFQCHGEHLQHVDATIVNTTHQDLETVLSSEIKSADVFSQLSLNLQRVILTHLLRDDDLVQHVLKSISEVSVIMLVNSCKFLSSC